MQSLLVQQLHRPVRRIPLRGTNGLSRRLPLQRRKTQNLLLVRSKQPLHVAITQAALSVVKHDRPVLDQLLQTLVHNTLTYFYVYSRAKAIS